MKVIAKAKYEHAVIGLVVTVNYVTGSTVYYQDHYGCYCHCSLDTFISWYVAV